jgi:hypothetical protein
MSASPATAVVVDFESVPSTSNTTYKVPFTTQGFTFTPLSEVSVIDDPTYLVQPFMTSTNFKKEAE